MKRSLQAEVQQQDDRGQAGVTTPPGYLPPLEDGPGLGDGDTGVGDLADLGDTRPDVDREDSQVTSPRGPHQSPMEEGSNSPPPSHSSPPQGAHQPLRVGVPNSPPQMVDLPPPQPLPQRVRGRRGLAQSDPLQRLSPVRPGGRVIRRR